MARTVGRCVRTLTNYKNLDPEAPPKSPGPPRRSEESYRDVRELVRAELETRGWATGYPTLWPRVKERSTAAQLRRALGELKAQHKARQRAVRERERITNEVLATDAVWALDATHLVREEDGRAVQAEVLREVASIRTLGLSVGPPATQEEVIGLLERTWQERGTLPLVLVTDNGGPYVGEELAAWLREHEIVHLRNLPRTPQHNAWSERGIGELKVDALVKCWPRGLPCQQALDLLCESAQRIDFYRPRVTRGWLTAVQADGKLPHATRRVRRPRFYAVARCAIRQAVLDCSGARARRRAEREAVLNTLQRFKLIRRTRGGVPLCSHSRKETRE